MLLIGASHINHLESFVKGRHTPTKFSYPFSRSFFLGVGGTKWETCLKHFEGKELTTSNKHRGNQWAKFHTSSIKPAYTIISLGSNSVDETDKKIRKLKNNPHLTTEEFWKRAKKLQEDRIEELLPKIGNVIHIIKSNAPYSDILYVKILPRHWWHPLSRDIARALDKHVIFGLKRRFRIKEIWPKLL